MSQTVNICSCRLERAHPISCHDLSIAHLLPFEAHLTDDFLILGWPYEAYEVLHVY